VKVKGKGDDDEGNSGKKSEKVYSGKIKEKKINKSKKKP